jgi:hypothetical protein
MLVSIGGARSSMDPYHRFRSFQVRASNMSRTGGIAVRVFQIPGTFNLIVVHVASSSFVSGKTDRNMKILVIVRGEVGYFLFRRRTL